MQKNKQQEEGDSSSSSATRTNKKNSRENMTTSFGDFVHVRLVPSLNDMDDRTIDRIWYSRDEFRHMKRRDRALVRKLCKDPSRTSFKEDLMLGLESQYDRLARCSQAAVSRKTVLSEQARQRHADEFCPERISELYQAAAEDELRNAVSMGQRVASDEVKSRSNSPNTHCDDASQESSGSDNTIRILSRSGSSRDSLEGCSSKVFRSPRRHKKKGSALEFAGSRSNFRWDNMSASIDPPMLTKRKEAALL